MGSERRLCETCVKRWHGWPGGKTTSSSAPHSAAMAETVASLTTSTPSSSTDLNPECRLAASGRTHTPALFLKSSPSDRRYGSDAAPLCVTGVSDETKASHDATILRSDALFVILRRLLCWGAMCRALCGEDGTEPPGKALHLPADQCSNLQLMAGLSLRDQLSSSDFQGGGWGGLRIEPPLHRTERSQRWWVGV